MLDNRQMSIPQQRMLGLVLLVAGLAIAGMSVARMPTGGGLHAQLTSPPASSAAQPAEALPGGTRPTTPAPEPARPQNNEGATTGSSTLDRPPVTGTPLPPAPAEKMAPPVQRN